MKSYLIIGAGFSGTVLAARLINEAGTRHTSVYLINGSGRIARGMAYGTHSPFHVLNVPAGNMSAFEELPNHFLDYARVHDSTILPGSFVSRRIYGDYLESILNEAERNAPAHVHLHRVYRKVKHIKSENFADKSIVTLDDGVKIEVDKVILALGHFPSARVPIENPDFYTSERYIHDPWSHDSLDSIPSRAPVVLLGTGLTAVDVAMTLLSRNPARKIVAISRRGLLPQAHRHTAGKPMSAGVDAIWEGANTVRLQIRAFRKYCRMLATEGRDWREALALLRPATAGIWSKYPEIERRRFLRHVQPYWDSHRHRLAPEVAEKLTAARASGTMQALSGRLLKINVDQDEINVHYRPRGFAEYKVVQAQYVVNCTGPCADPRQTSSDLMTQLFNDNLVKLDSLALGIDVTADCAVISASGNASNNLFYIGPWLKARYWEATAVPDLRVIAKNLSRRLTEDS